MKKGLLIVVAVGLIYMSFEYGRMVERENKPSIVEWPSDHLIDSLQAEIDSLQASNRSLEQNITGYEIENRRLRRDINSIDIPQWSDFSTGSVDTGRYSLERVLSNLHNSRRYHFGDTTYWSLQRIKIRDSLVLIMRGAE